jgi:hypothetical protein
VRESVQGTGHDFLDVPGQRGMGFGGSQIGFDDAEPVDLATVPRRR